jgi:hypothetical protein
LTGQQSETISGTVDVADAGTSVTILDGSTQIGTAVVQGDGSWADAVILPTGDGTHLISATDTDAAGNTGTSDAITFTLDTTPPKLAINSTGGLTNHINETISGTVDVGDAGTTVIILDRPSGMDGSTQIGTAVVQSDGSWTDAVDLLTGNGDHFVSAMDTDAAGNTGYSDTITFTLDTSKNTPPKIAITSVSGDDVVDSSEINSEQGVHGTSDAIGQTVDVLVDGVEAGQAVVQADGTWLTTVGFASAITGEHDVTAEVSDEAGTPGRADASVYVDRGTAFQQLSVGPNGEQGSGNGVIFPSLSADGTKLAFTGLNFGLVSPAAGPDHAQVYVKNLTTGAISIVTPDPSADSEFGSISPNGNLVAFVSKTNLDPVTHQNYGVPAGNDTYVVNLTTGVVTFRGFDAPDSDNFDNGLSTFPLPVTDDNQTTVPYQSGIYTGIYASPSPGYLTGVLFAPGPSGYGLVQLYDPQLSDDGKIFALEGVIHAELFPGVSPRVTQIYAGDWNANSKLPLVSSFADGTPLPFGAYDPALSGDGKSIAFWAESPSHQWEVYVKNLTNGALTIASSDATGAPETSDPGFGLFRTGAESIAISDDGRYVAFESEDTAFTGGTPATIDLYVKDMVSGAIQQIALPQGAAAAEQLDMSADGSLLAFVSATPLVASDTNGVSDIYGVVLNAPAPPKIAFDAVASDDRLNATEISGHVAITGTSDAIGQSVALFVDGVKESTVTVAGDGTWSTEIDATLLADGVHPLRASVTDSHGSTGSGGDLLTVDRVAPTVVLSSDRTHLTAGQAATITASFSEGIGNLASNFLTATGGTLDKLQFVDDHTLTAIFTPTPGAGSFEIEANPDTAFDLAGNPNAVGASLSIACYCRGTLIATDRGEIVVEDLAIGDQVVTPSGARPIKWIGTRSYGGRFILGRKDMLPICFKQGSLGDGLPRRDLWISPHHAMYLDGVLIEAKDLVNGVSVIQAEEIDRVDYFHIELDSHDVILAEGAWSETFVDDDSRGMFHNAQDYAALYPHESSEPARYCVPRLDTGYEVEAARRLIDERAGLDAAGAEVGDLRGYVDRIDDDMIEGWAQNAAYPEAPVCLDIVVGDEIVGQALANRYREDLRQAGIGNGKHGFCFNLPRGGYRSQPVTVRRSLDQAALRYGATYARRCRASGRDFRSEPARGWANRLSVKIPRSTST